MNVLCLLAQWALGVPSSPDPGANAHTSSTEVERIAALWAQQNKKAWTRLVKTTFKIGDGRDVWVVESNFGGKGHRIFVTIDDLTGEVVSYDEIHPR